MADTPKEVQKFELDITDVQAKARVVQQLLDEIAAGRKGGQDVSELEKQLDRELRSLSRVPDAAQRNRSAMDELGRSKRDLADVVSLLGGKFGGLIGDIEGTAQAFLGGSGLVAGVSAAVAGIALVTGHFAKMAEKAREAEERIRALSAAMAQQRQEEMNERGQTADESLKLGFAGAADQINADVDRMMRGGIPQDFARSAAMARLVAQRSGQAFNEQEFLEGLAVSGGAHAFTGDARQDAAAAARIQAAGGRADADEALAEHAEDKRHETARALRRRRQSEREGAIDTAMDELKDFGLSDSVIADARNLVENPNLLQRREDWTNNPFRRFIVNNLSLLGGDKPEAQKRAEQEARQVLNRLGPAEFGDRPLGGGDAPVIFAPINVNAPGTQINGAGNPLMQPWPSAAPGEGMTNR